MVHLLGPTENQYKSHAKSDHHDVNSFFTHVPIPQKIYNASLIQDCQHINQ